MGGYNIPTRTVRWKCLRTRTIVEPDAPPPDDCPLEETPMPYDHAVDAKPRVKTIECDSTDYLVTPEHKHRA
jgi:hypothetical protein